MKTILASVIVGFLLGSQFLLADAPAISNVTAVTESIPRFSKFEASVALTAAYSNPYDYSEICVQGIFHAPSGRNVTVDGFYMQDQQIAAGGWIYSVGTSSFRVRFTPDEVGTWTYSVQCTTAQGVATSGTQSFVCVASTAKGFIRKAAPNYLSFDDGSQYIPIGMDVCWGSESNNSVVQDYTNYLNKLSANGANFIRIWMAAWSFGIEWGQASDVPGFGGLKQYQQADAFELDWLLETCRQKGIAVMICDNIHDQVMSTGAHDWQNNPYNSAKGGVCATPRDFFTNGTAQAIYKNRLRYMVARFGYSPQIQSWEIFNEVDQLWTSPDELALNHTTESDVTAWTQVMAAYLKSIDVSHHLVTTSAGSVSTQFSMFQLPEIDFAQMHSYLPVANPENVVTGFDKQYLAAYGKPILNGEYGIDVYGNEAYYDPTGVHFHNGLWAILFSGAMGPAVEWNWNHYIDPDDLYYHFTGVSSFSSAVSFKTDSYQSTASTTSTSSVCDLTIIPTWNQWGGAPGSFAVDPSGAVTPDASQMSQILFGLAGNRQPFLFQVNYPVAGQFKFTAGLVSSQGGNVMIAVDGTQLDHEAATTNAVYTVNVPAGVHTIMVDNDGADWVQAVNFGFINAGNPLASHVMKSANGMKAVGWIQNKPYDWKYFQDHSGVAPAAVPSGTVTVPGVQNGTYTVQFYNCLSGAVNSTTNVAVTQGQLVLPLPAIAWDTAFTAVNMSPQTTYGATTLTPGWFGWGNPPATNFAVAATGQSTPSTSQLSCLLYGTAQFRSATTFQANFLVPGKFVLTTGSISSGGGHVLISCDGTLILSTFGAPNSVYQIDVPAGAHSITIDNDGNDWIQVSQIVLTNTRTQLNETSITPLWQGWGIAPSTEFTVDGFGAITPDASQMNYLLFGVAQYRSPVTFQVSYPVAGSFKVVTTSNISAGGAKVLITVDGNLLVNTPATGQATYSVNIPLGNHVITVDNDGSDWIQIARYVFSHTGQ